MAFCSNCGAQQGDNEDVSFLFDWEMIEAFGGMEGFEEWLIYGLGLYADD